MKDTSFKVVGERRDQGTPSARVVFFHHAGGSPESYMALREHLPLEWEIQFVRLTRTPTPARIAVDSMARALLVEASPPILFFGHSMGGTLAYHVALAGARLALPAPACLVVSSSAPPEDPLPFADRSRARYSDSTFWELLYDMIYLGGVPRRLTADESALRFAVEAYREDIKLLESLCSLKAAVLDIPLGFARGDQDLFLPADSAVCWKRLSTCFLGASDFPGGHFYHVDRPKELCVQVEEWFEQSLQVSTATHNMSASRS